MKHPRSNRGFTLVELLTVLAVLSVVTFIGMRALVVGTGTWRTTSLRMDLNTTADRALKQMGSDFNQVLSQELSGVPLKGISGTVMDNNRFWRVDLADDRIILPIEYIQPQTGLIEHASVMYSIDRSGPTPVLTRTLGALGANPPEGARQFVADGVLALRIEYSDGAAWLPAWDNPGLPQAVRVRLGLMDTNRNYEQIARESAYTIHLK